ncbi:hypothetical protein Aph01nite_61870 [Acrocarpospora phusangensis]|uniref:Integral membrane protein n=1 Tax=Acrocarpospora phusangensis TaxID=1070424 RepID=A0A919QFA3_9ACTN|nr:DUF6113 family protein [Acrocarpospora phusangensis]GIH27877.1 hypothetical protein Aph01nite_61870 [Acrocarpospora phusangensis]
MMGAVAPEVTEKPVITAGFQAAVTGAAYGTLIVLGAVLGVLGGFSHSWYVFDVPVAAIGWVLLLLAVPYGMGRLMGTRLAALVPSVGWLAVSLGLAGQRPEGDLTIAADVSGYVYLYGCTVALVVAVLLVPSTGVSWLLRQNVRIK